MKKFVLTLAFFFATFSIMAQEHLSFKGIPIQGSLTEFCKKLEAKGFKDLGPGENKNSHMLTGEFAGMQSYVCIYATNSGKKVVDVSVMFDPSEEWRVLSYTYYHFKELYSNKYGSPKSEIEENNARSENNVSQMLSLIGGTTTFCSIWGTSGGEISLMIIKSPIGYGGAVCINYRDSQNSNTKYLNELNDI